VMAYTRREETKKADKIPISAAALDHGQPANAFRCLSGCGG
jgi:hypothetical protein